MLLRSLFFYIFILLFLSGCGVTSVEVRRQSAKQIGDDANFTSFVQKTQMFSIFGFYSLSQERKDAVIYIEGDGLAWINRHRVSSNPTPSNHMMLKLATLDQSPNVFYLSRPCQFVFLEKEKKCHYAYWTYSRFSENVIASFDQALDSIKQNFGIKSFHLVGFSGGGAVAVLVAARRDDILTIRTIAGNLDHKKVNSYHHVSELKDSLNAIDFIEKVKHIPQIHFSGARDKIVPPFIASDFITQFNHQASCVQHVMVQGASHANGWLEIWPELSLISCQKKMIN